MTRSFKPDVICLSETRVQQPLTNIQINGYDFVNVKLNGKAGGVAVCTNTYLKFTQINSFQLHGAESLWLKVWHENQNKTFVIGTIYRHPNENVHEFLDDFSECLETLMNENKTFYPLGDININGSCTRPAQDEEHLNAIASNGVIPLITRPTRVTENSAAIIDHIITNDVEHYITPCVVVTNIADHDFTMCQISKFNAVQKTNRWQCTAIKETLTQKFFQVN